jgi:hypothetical protein
MTFAILVFAVHVTNPVSFVFIDLSGLSLQSGPSRLVKDEYSAGVVGGTGMEVDGDVGVNHAVPQTIQHHPPPPQFSLGLQQQQQTGKKECLQSE